jgi:6-phosphogluconolactonase
LLPPCPTQRSAFCYQQHALLPPSTHSTRLTPRGIWPFLAVLFVVALHYFAMKITRRFFALLALTSAVTTLTLTFAGQKSASTHYLALVGTYTNKTTSKGIYGFDFDSATGKLTAKGVAVETPDPSWVAIHPNGKFVYAANESGKQSTITAFALDAAAGKLTQLNQLSALGEDPCYLSFDKTGKYLFVANYTSGNVVVFPILPDGKLGEHTANVKDTGTLGPNKERQEAPHAHWVEASAGNRFAYVADLGLDRVLIYPFEASKGTLASPSGSGSGAEGVFSVKLTLGAGPRHVAFSSKSNFMYVLGEMQSTVSVFANEHQEVWRPIQEISALPELFSGRNDAAEIAIHPGGKWLFTSNRGHDTIAVFAINPADGTLRKTGDFPTGGQEPRHFALDPTGKFLLAENQNSNSIVVLRINPATGALTLASQTSDIPSPVCLAFLPH